MPLSKPHKPVLKFHSLISSVLYHWNKADMFKFIEFHSNNMCAPMKYHTSAEDSPQVFQSHIYIHFHNFYHFYSKLTLPNFNLCVHLSNF